MRVCCSFLNYENPTSLFPVRDRQRVAYEILATTVYGNRENGEIGIDRLLDDDVYAAAFPLHDVYFTGFHFSVLCSFDHDNKVFRDKKAMVVYRVHILA